MIIVLTALIAAAPPVPVVCDTTPAVTEIHASWRAIYTSWAGRDLSLPEASTGAEFRTALCGETPCPTDEPTIASVWDGDQLMMSLVMPVAGKVHELRLPSGWREYQCSPDGQARMERKGDLLHVVATVTAPQVEGVDPDGKPCNPDLAEPGECQRGCSDGGEVTRVEWLVHPKTGAALRLGALPKGWTVKGTKLTAPGCKPVRIRSRRPR